MARRLCALPLIALAVLAGCERGSKSVQIDPALATLIPARATLLAGIRVEEARATPVYQKWLAGRPFPGVEDITKETGIDPRKDLWEVLIASAPAGSVALARGKFSEQGQEPKPRREGVQRTSYRGYTLVGDDESAVTFINPGTAAAGTPAMVRAVIDQRSSPNPDAGEDLLKMAKTIPYGTHAWLVSAGELSGRELPKTGNLANLGRFSKGVESATAVVNLGTGVKADIKTVFRTSEDAAKLHEALRALVTMARAMTPDSRPEMRQLYDAIRLAQNDRTVSVVADVSDQALGGLLGKPEAPAAQ